jgi:UDP-glucose 6-dehydrogenase
MNVAIFGAGYVGCITAACLAAFGHRVWPVEIHPEKLALLRQGQSPVFEPKLDSAFANEIASLETAFGADANAVMETFCLDRSLNLSAAYLRPGFAFGGACLPKDLHVLNRVAAAAASAARYGR